MHTHTCSHARTHTHIHTYTHAHTYIHTHTHTRTHAHTHTRASTHAHMHTHTYTHTHIHTCTHTHTHTHTVRNKSYPYTKVFTHYDLHSNVSTYSMWLMRALCVPCFHKSSLPSIAFCTACSWPSLALLARSPRTRITMSGHWNQNMHTRHGFSCLPVSNILSNTGHENNVAQPKADLCLSSATHFSPF